MFDLSVVCSNFTGLKPRPDRRIHCQTALRISPLRLSEGSLVCRAENQRAKAQENKLCSCELVMIKIRDSELQRQPNPETQHQAYERGLVTPASHKQPCCPDERTGDEPRTVGKRCSKSQPRKTGATGPKDCRGTLCDSILKSFEGEQPNSGFYQSSFVFGTVPVILHRATGPWSPLLRRKRNVPRPPLDRPLATGPSATD